MRPLSAGLAVPLFALFSAGVAISGSTLADVFTRPETLGVVLGLIVGKAVGIFGGTWFAARFTKAELNDDLAWPDVFAVASLAGIGFTVSLLIGELAFDGQGPLTDEVKAAVLVGSLTAAVLSSVLLKMRVRKYKQLVEDEERDEDQDGIPDVYELGKPEYHLRMAEIYDAKAAEHRRLAQLAGRGATTPTVRHDLTTDVFDVCDVLDPLGPPDLPDLLAQPDLLDPRDLFDPSATEKRWGSAMSDPSHNAGSAERSLGQLVASATAEMSALVHDEIALAKAELRQDVKRGAIGGLAISTAGVLAVFALPVLSFAAAYGIHNLGLGLAWSFLIVGGAFLVLAGLLGCRRDQVQEGQAAGEVHRVGQGDGGGPARRQAAPAPATVEVTVTDTGADCGTLVCMTAPEPGTGSPGGTGSPVRINGPWVHRDVAANGARFHIAELGDGPLVLLLHGFPQFWWTWRHQLTALADAGYRAVAMDLRGVGGSDRTPRGYDPATRAGHHGRRTLLGEPDAALVGPTWAAIWRGRRP